MLKSLQKDSLATTDTLSQSYSDKWEGVASGEEVGAFVQFMSSNDLIYVVLGVTLIIWAILLFFLFRVDKKVNKLEDQINNLEI